jgi:cobalt transporter subunit CbtA
MQRIVMAALLAGALAGLAAFALHLWQTTPLILHAEVYEGGSAPAAAGHSHAPAPSAPAAQAQKAGPEKITDDLGRHVLTLLADVVIAVGFGFLLVGAMALSGRGADWRRGIVWGLCGYAAFYVAPSLGLAPELPGMVAAELGARQAWWLGTAAAAVVALGLIFLTQGALWKVLAALLLVAPQAIGAPHPVMEAGNVPAELAAQFATASLVVTGLFWMVLGGLGGYFYQRLAPNA